MFITDEDLGLHGTLLVNLKEKEMLHRLNKSLLLLTAIKNPAVMLLSAVNLQVLRVYFGRCF